MSKSVFDDNCTGCKPVLGDMTTGKALPDDDPKMLIINKVWETTTLAEHEAFHDVCCNNSRNRQVMARAKAVADRMSAALR